MPEETKSSRIVNDGESLVKAYEAAQERLTFAKADVSRAEVDFTNAQNALGKWLIPQGAHPFEKFGIWHAGKLFQAEKGGDGGYIVRIRQ